MFLCLRCHPRPVHMMGQVHPAAGRTLPIRHPYLLPWPRLSLPWSTPPPTTRAFCAKWRPTNFNNTEEEFPSRTKRYYLSGVLRNPTTALRQGRGTLGSRRMGASNGTEIRANPMHRGSEAPICHSAVKRPRQHLVGKLFCHPTCGTSSHLGRVQVGI
jgi:hypothetical protein